MKSRPYGGLSPICPMCLWASFCSLSLAGRLRACPEHLGLTSGHWGGSALGRADHACSALMVPADNLSLEILQLVNGQPMNHSQSTKPLLCVEQSHLCAGSTPCSCPSPPASAKKVTVFFSVFCDLRAYKISPIMQFLVRFRS